MKPVETTAAFVSETLGLSRATGAVVVSIDFDHMGYFLNRYGSESVLDAVALCRDAILARLSGFSGAALFSSADEVQVVTAWPAGALAAQLRAVSTDVTALGRERFPGDAAGFGFTAAIAELPAGVSYAGLRCLDAALRRILDDKRGIRGQVVQVDACATETANHDLAETVRSLAPVDATQFSPLSAPSGGALLVVSPQFGGSAFAGYSGRGVTEMPDGSTVGKLGFLNRVFGEHLTPNLLVEAVLGELAASLAPYRVRRNASLLYVEDPSDGLSFSCLQQAVDRFNARLGPGLQVAPLRLARLPSALAHSRLPHDLGHHIFKVPGPRFACDGLLAIYDYRSVSHEAFASTYERYRLKALDQVRDATADEGTREVADYRPGDNLR